MKKKIQPVDLRVDRFGSVSLLHRLTSKGLKWCAKNVQFESWQLVGGADGAIAVERRAAADIVHGARASGLKVTA